MMTSSLSDQIEHDIESVIASDGCVTIEGVQVGLFVFRYARRATCPKPNMRVQVIQSPVSSPMGSHASTPANWRSAVSVAHLCEALQLGRTEITALQDTLAHAQRENSSLIQQMKEVTSHFEMKIAEDAEAHRDEIERVSFALSETQSECEILREENAALKARLLERDATFESGAAQVGLKASQSKS